MEKSGFAIPRGISRRKTELHLFLGQELQGYSRRSIAALLWSKQNRREVWLPAETKATTKALAKATAEATAEATAKATTSADSSGSMTKLTVLVLTLSKKLFLSSYRLLAIQVLIYHCSLFRILISLISSNHFFLSASSGAEWERQES